MKKSVLVLLVLLSSCGNIDCIELSKIYRNYKCHLIVKNLNDSSSIHNFDVTGISLKSKKDTLYKQENRWFCTYYAYIEKGDTIIKNEGELTFNVHKKDTILSFDWECEGKIYK